MVPTQQKSVHINGKPFVLLTDDNTVIGINDIYDPEMTRLMSSVVKPSDTALDVGANIGCTAIMLSTMCKHVDAFEPMPTTFQMLQANIRAANLTNITTYNIGLGDTNIDTIGICNERHRAGAWVANITPGLPSHHTEEIHIKRLDDLTPALTPNLIKIDTEGFEKHVLSGGKNTVAKNKPIVVLECNHWCLDALQRITIPEFFDFLCGMFPVLYAIEKNTYLDLHNKNERFCVMYRHIVLFQYLNLVGAFPSSDLQKFRTTYTHEEVNI